MDHEIEQMQAQAQADEDAFLISVLRQRCVALNLEVRLRERQIDELRKPVAEKTE